MRWVDSATGEDFTDRMDDPSIPPGEGVLELARAIARWMAAEDLEAARRLLQDLAAVPDAGIAPDPRPRTAQPGDELMVAGRTYRYDGATAVGEHFTRLGGETWGEAHVSLRPGSAAAAWMLSRLSPHAG